VVGVQFQLDGANLGSEVSASPYTVSWDTTQTSNSGHILTAIARDAAGNRATSSGVTVTVNNGLLHSYSTSFPLTENPISEGGHWINGASVGLDWSDVRTVAGLAYGTETGSGGYDDSTAILTGAWGPDQTCQATVHSINQNSNVYEEVECRLRSAISAAFNTGYEINFRCVHDGSQYVQIVRWNGPLGSFTYVNSTTGPGIYDGDVIKATISGSTITAYINNVQIVQGTDRTYTTGNPGMGFYLQGTANNSDFGFTSFTATDGSTTDTTPPSTPRNLPATAISSSRIDLSWNASTDNVAVAGYRVFRNNQQIATTTSATFSDTTAIPGTPYTYAVSAFDAAGNVSAQSSPVLAQTSTQPDITPPSVPANLQSSNATSTSLTVAWSASTDNVAVAGYQIFRNGTQVATTTATSYNDSGLTPSTTYAYTVAAFDSSGNVSAQSQPLLVTTAAAAATAPTLIQINQNQISSGTSTPVTLNTPTVAGHTIVAYVIWNNTGMVALSDSRGNAFTSASGPVSWGSGYSAQVFYGTVVVGGTDTVTATFRTAVSSFGVVYVHEYAGISTVNPVDVTASASGSSATLNSGAATTTSANDLIFGAGVSDNYVTAAGTGFVARDLAFGNITEDRIAGSIGSYAATATHNGQMWGMQMVAFRAAQ
jgi:chitodextrinase